MLKLLSLFSGIGAFEKALENIDEQFQVIRYCEIDKYASKAYSLIHNLDENLNLKDVTTVNTEELPNDIDIITYGFPCQDISQSGKQKGFTDDEGNLTRSGLFFEALRIIEDTQPKFAIAENVKALTGKKFKTEFKIVLDSLNDAGYTNYWAVLNAKDYGIPQNRERVFIISIRNDINHGFHFPQKYELKLRLKDLLEDSVDEKYYLSDKMISFFLENEKKQREKGNGFRFNVTDGNVVGKAITTLAGNRMDDNFICEQLSFFDDSPVIQKVDVPQLVKIRKYEVDKEKLVKTLRHQKKICGWSNKELAEELEIPITQVEHWFRTDKHFSIPDPEIWSDLKWLLEMDDINEFDKAIMTFENREGTYEKAERCYHENGISPTITAAMANEKIITNQLDKPLKVVNLYPSNGQAGNVYDSEGIAPCLPGFGAGGGGKELKIIDALPIKEATKKGYKEAHEGDYVNLQYPNSETRRGRVGEQVANTLLCNDAQGVVVPTAHFTDNYLQWDRSGKGYNSQQDRAYYQNGIAPALSNSNASGDKSQVLLDNLRIRKLTPKECFRLMGFDDKDCDVLVANGISNTQLYKMAGNSIVVDVLEEIFVELLNQYEDVFPMR